MLICARSSVDRAPASGAGCVGSIPVGRTNKKKSRPYGLLFLYIIYTLYLFDIAFHGFVKAHFFKIFRMLLV